MPFFVSNIYINPVRVSVIGDSIAAGFDPAVVPWPTRLNSYNNGFSYTVTNHAVVSQTILAHMDAQVVATASDNARIILLALGTNDIGANAAAVTAEVEENIDELRGTNTSASVCYLNILDRVTGDPTAIRSAINTACTNKTATCWSTIGWIDPATDTLVGGVHPNDAGYVKFMAQLIPLLPA
jgi:lysophospholipase L1-like esterase